jgi:AraC-like DNA-binding protein
MNTMIHYDQISPREPLSDYIEDYVFVQGNQHITKTITPQTEISLVFDFQRSSLLKNQRFNVAVVGLHDHEFGLDSVALANDKLLIRLSPYGLTKLTGVSSRLIFNQIVDAAEVFGEEVNNLYEQLKYMDSNKQRITYVEAFLLKRLQTPSASDELIFELAEKIRQDPYHFSLANLKKALPLSPRQIERKFKALIGTNMQSYLRLARFEKAKSLLESNQFTRLTDIGYEAGYYDQAHFSSEFKKLAGVAPKSYDPCSVDQIFKSGPNVAAIQFLTSN